MSEKQQLLKKMKMNLLPTQEGFKQKNQYSQCLGFQDEEHYNRLRSSENNKKDTERKVKRAVIDTINARETFTKSTAVRSITDAVCSHRSHRVRAGCSMD